MIYLVNLPEKRILENAGDRLPIGLLSIASQLKKEGQEVKIMDLNHKDIVEFFQDFYEDKPEITGISVYTSPIVEEAKDLAWTLKGKTRLVAGGIHATHMPETLTDFDLIIRGEGEQMGELMKSDLRGVVTADSPNLQDIANLDYDLLDVSKYGVDQSGKRTGTLITSRGCFGDCSFCGKLENKVRFEPLDKVFTQMRKLKEKGFESLYFLDDIFTANKKRMNYISMFANKLNMPFRVTTRADLIDEDKIRVLSDNGCEWLSLGIESGNDRILQKSNKKMDIRQNYEAIRLAHKYGIKTKGFFIIGLPGETEKTARQTINYSRMLNSVGLTKADFYFLTPFPGTPIWNNPDSFGIEITDRDYTKYLEAGKNAKCYVNTEELKAGRIEELVKEAKSQWKN